MEKVVSVETSDNKIIIVEKSPLQNIALLRNMTEDLDDDSVIPLKNVVSGTFEKILEYCSLKLNFSCDLETLNNFDSFENVEKTFIKGFNEDELLWIITTADFLEVPRLLYLACCQMASIIKLKTPEEIRKLLEINE